MTTSRAWLMLALMFVTLGAGAETGVVTLLEGGPRLLRGATWYKLAVGARIEDSDIIDAPDRSQIQLELSSGARANLVGTATMYLVPAAARSSPAPNLLSVAVGWLKVATGPPGLRIRTAPFDLIVTEGIVVVHAAGPVVELFVEVGSAKLVELAASGSDGPAREIKAGEYLSRSAAGAYTTGQRAPKTFILAMPKHFVDPLPTLASRIKAKPTLVVDHEITYAEAESWLAGRDRTVFERRFASRLRDPTFRSAVLPHVARYPMWDRQLNPEKYAPKDKVAK